MSSAGMIETKATIEFLNEAARYFERLDTNGEDIAFWANVSNAENCRKAASLIAALSTTHNHEEM